MTKGFIQGGKLKRDALATGHHKYCISLVQLAPTRTLSWTTSSRVSSWQTTGSSITSEQQTTCLFESVMNYKLMGIDLTYQRFVDNIREDNISVQVSVLNYKLTGIFLTNHRFVDNIWKDIRLWPFILAGLALVLVYHQCIRDSDINTGAMIPFITEITLYHELTTVRFPANTVLLLVIFLILILNYFLGVFEFCYQLRHFFVLTRHHPIMIHYENCIS